MGASIAHEQEKLSWKKIASWTILAHFCIVKPEKEVQTQNFGHGEVYVGMSRMTLVSQALSAGLASPTWAAPRQPGPGHKLLVFKHCDARWSCLIVQMILKDNCSSHPVFQLNTADEQSRLTLQVASNNGLGNGFARGWESWPKIRQQTHGLTVQDSPLAFFKFNGTLTRSLTSVR